MPGIKETTEGLIAANEFTLMMMDVLSDGAQVGDFMALYVKYNSDPGIKAKIDAGIKDLNKAKQEIPDIDLTEAAALIGVQVSYVPRIVAALKGK